MFLVDSDEPVLIIIGCEELCPYSGPEKPNIHLHPFQGLDASHLLLSKIPQLYTLLFLKPIAILKWVNEPQDVQVSRLVGVFPEACSGLVGGR